MSKKIKICISDKLRPNLHKLFHEYLDSKFDNINRYYDDLSYGYGNDIYDTVFPYDDGRDAYIQFWEEEARKQELRAKRRKDALIKSRSKSSKLSDDEYVDVEEYDGKGRKKKHRHSKSKSRSNGLGIHVPYSGYEENPDEVYESSHVMIWYYPNYNDKDDRLEFDSLKDFDDFCLDEGILVPPYMFQELINHSVSHVCLNPICMERGIKELIVSGTYNDLLFNVYDLSEYDDEGICSRYKI